MNIDAHLAVSRQAQSLAKWLEATAEPSRSETRLGQIELPGEVPPALLPVLGGGYSHMNYEHIDAGADPDPSVKLTLFKRGQYNYMELYSQPKNTTDEGLVFDVVPRDSQVATASLRLDDVTFLLDSVMANQEGAYGLLTDPRLDNDDRSRTRTITKMLTRSAKKRGVQHTFSSDDQRLSIHGSENHMDMHLEETMSRLVIAYPEGSGSAAYTLSLTSPVDIGKDRTVVEHFSYAFSERRDLRRPIDGKASLTLASAEVPAVELQPMLASIQGKVDAQGIAERAIGNLSERFLTNKEAA